MNDINKDCETENGKKSIASPISTGQSGAFFEQHVNTTWLSLLLVKGIPPLLLDSQITELAFQTERLGWNTDDVLVQAENGEGQKKKLVCQVKRTFRVSSSDEESRKTFRDFWLDFTSEKFNSTYDRLALITLRGTNNLLLHFSSLLESAAASRSLEDFNNRISTKGLLNNTAKKYALEIRKGLENDEITVNDEAYWQFLKSLAVLSFDLNTTTKQTESWIKSLLAHTAIGADKVGIAKSTWDDLLNFASKAMPSAQIISLKDIPSNIKEAHGIIEGRDHTALTKLKDHSSVILRGIHSLIGGKVALNRDELVSAISESICKNRVTLIGGAAGAGKSAIAKKVLEQLDRQYFTTAFRAEEFAKAHLDQTLSESGFDISSEKLSGLLSGQGQKVILIESVERLLESSVRDSFADLLKLMEQDCSWKLIITCRSYSMDIVVASFFGQSSMPFNICDIPPLTDDDLLEVGREIPKLTPVLKKKELRYLFKNPYVLDKAVKMPWHEGEKLPENERGFRKLFWKEIVREDDKVNESMPTRRDESLRKLALRRAKALSLYAKCDDLDRDALRKLHERDLIIFSEETDSLAAPAHDVLEDWALQNWMGIEFVSSEKEPQKISKAISTFPALRRAYRMWLSELSELDPIEADIYVSLVINDESLPAHFRDDTIVAILKTAAAPSFLTRNRQLLLKNNSAQLKRVIHLLRVACKSMPEWLAAIGYMQSSIMTPTGEAWPKVLLLVKESLSDLLPESMDLLLGLLEDWANIVTINNPYPEGYKDAACIAFELLKISKGYDREKVRNRIYRILSKVPSGNKDSFVSLMSGHERDGREKDEFSGFLVEGLDSSYVAKEFSDQLIELTKNYLYLSPEERNDSYRSYGRIDIDEFFGLKEHRKFYPPSAIRGPFQALLQQHFKKGIEFIISFVNYASECYANPQSRDRLEPPWEVEILFPDSSTSIQWHNPRLWQLYRGTSVGPYSLMCALMALEKFLLEIGKIKIETLDSWLSYILRKSNNSALSAVVTSIAVAYPSQCKETVKILLSSRDFIELDQQMGAIGRGMSQIQSMFPSLDAESQVYETERKDADSLPHRRKYLGITALELQTTDVQKDIQDIIDKHLASLPPIKKQSKEDKIWRFTLHKLDLRQYTPKVASGGITDAGQAEENSSEQEIEKLENKAAIYLEPKSPAKDIKKVLDEDRPKLDLDQERMGLLNWGLSCFSRDGKADSSEWEKYLSRAMQVPSGSSTSDVPSWESSPAVVAAVCARDHWTELDIEQKQWCLNSIEESVIRDRDSENHLIRVSRNSMSADRPSALALSAILVNESDSEIKSRVENLLADAIFHSCDEVAVYAAAGIGQYLWDNNPDIALRFSGAIAQKGIDLDKCYEKEFSKPYDQRNNFEELCCSINKNLREKLKKGEEFDSQKILSLSLGKPFGGEAVKPLLQIFKNVVNVEIVDNFFALLIKQLCIWWVKEDRDSRVPYELMYHYQDIVARYLLSMTPERAIGISKPVADLIKTKPREVAKFIRDLISAEDSSHVGKETFWALWDKFADGIKESSWLTRVDDRYFSNDEILQSIFLNIHWKKGVKKWEPHNGFEDRVVSFFTSVPPSAAAIDQMAAYLYYIGDVTLPSSFIPLSKKIKEKPTILSGGNTVFYLEQIMQKYVYGTPQALKANRLLREAVIDILDELVNKGSSAAFKMRDDFVTPLT